MFQMCLGPYKNDSDLATIPREDFLIKSSLITFAIYSTILSLLFSVLNNFSDFVSLEKWNFFYLCPFNPDDRIVLNCIVSSLLLSGTLSMILFRVRTWCRCCEKIVEKADSGQVLKILRFETNNTDIFLAGMHEM